MSCRSNCSRQTKMSGELSNMYKNSFMKLQGAERAGKDTVQSRMNLISNFKCDLNEQVEMLCEMLETTIQEKEEISCQLAQRTEQLECARKKLEEAHQEIECLQDHKSSLTLKVSSLNAEMERMSIEATRELEEQDEELCKLRRQNEGLQECVNRHAQEIENLTCQVRSLEQELRCAQSEAEAAAEAARCTEQKAAQYKRDHRHTNSEFSCKEEDVRALTCALKESERENYVIKQKLADLSRV